MKKQDIKENYVLDLSEESLAAANKKCKRLAILAALVYIPVAVLFIYPGFSSLTWLVEIYEANIAFVFLFILYLIAICWNAVQSYFSYTIRPVVPKKQAPLFGFEKMSYVGILLACFMGLAYSIYFAVIIVGYLIASGIFDYIGLIAFVSITASSIFSLYYYITTFNINKHARLEKEEEKRDESEPILKEQSTRLFHTYGLTEEEKELGKQEFESEDKNEQ